MTNRSKLLRLIRTGILLSAFSAVALASVAQAQITFTGGGTNQFDSTTATPYPLTISVPNMSRIESFRVTLSGVTATGFSGDLKALLVGPTGLSLFLFGGNTSGGPNGPVDWTFAIDGPPIPLDGAPTGTYSPNAANPNFVFTGNPATPPYGSFAAFQGTSAQGLWSLYLLDNAGGGAQQVLGWSLLFFFLVDDSLFIIDQGAILSTLQSGLPFALAQREILANVARTATRDVGGRLFKLRAGASFENGVAGPAGYARDGKEAKAVVEEPFRHLELFATGDYGNYDLEDTGAARGLGTDTWVGTAGLEWHLNRNLTWGLAVSGVTSDTEISRHIGGETVDGMAFSTYFSAAWPAFYVDALYSYGVFDHDVTRHTLVGGDAHGEFESRTHSTELNLGYHFKIGTITTGPLASLEWLRGDMDGYNERGGGTAALEYHGQNFDSLISRLGWQVSSTWGGKSRALTAQLRASWDHEYLNSAESVSTTLRTSPFATVTGTNVVRGADFSASAETSNPGRDYLNLGVGLSATFGERLTARTEYETHLFQDAASAHLFSAGVAWAF